MKIGKNALTHIWPLIHFGLSSVGAIAIDLTVFTLVCIPTENSLGRTSAIAIAVPCARIVSGHCNFYYNQHCVFKSLFSWTAYFKYWALVVFNAILLTAFAQLVSAWFDATGLAITLVNFLGQVVLFVFSFVIQKLIVFKHKG